MASQILITMDDLETAVRLNAALEAAQFSTTMFSSLDDARGTVRRENPDLVILTGAVHEPHAQQLAALAHDAEISTLALLEPTDSERTERVDRLHATEVMTKPVRPDDAVATARRLIERRHLQERTGIVGRERPDPGGAGQDRADGAGLQHGPDPGRERHRQGAGRQGAARPLASAGRGVHHGELRRPAGDAAGVGAVRPRERRLHRRRRAAAGPVRAGRRRDHLPRRDRRDSALHPGQAAAGAGEPDFLRVGGTQPIKVDVRVIAATNRALREAVALGEFRDDLYYRLNVLNIYLPPLRERRGDIPLLVRRFIREFAKAHDRQFRGITPEAMQRLVSAPWPGNVRQLRNLIESMVVLAPGAEIRATDIPVDVLEGAGHAPADAAGPGGAAGQRGSGAAGAGVHSAEPGGPPAPDRGDAAPDRRASPAGPGHRPGKPRAGDRRDVGSGWRRGPAGALPPGMTMAEVERATIEAALQEYKGNRRRAAEVLGIGERTLYRKIKAYQLE